MEKTASMAMRALVAVPLIAGDALIKVNAENRKTGLIGRNVKIVEYEKY